MHAGAESDAQTGALSPPLHLSTTFEHAQDGSLPHGLLYQRYDNPTQLRLQEALAALEDGECALFFATGMAAGRLKLFFNATSLGGRESLVEHLASIEGAHPVSPQKLLRLSIGLEDAGDLIADMQQALA